MADQGLLMDFRRPNREPRYMAAQFVIGIWEYQVKRLTPELAADVGEYLKTAFQPEVWGKAPQLRTIPVGESIANTAPRSCPMSRPSEILKKYNKFAVAPCICREEKGLLGESCGKPLETCLLMGGAAQFVPGAPPGARDHLRRSPCTSWRSPTRPGWCCNPPTRRNLPISAAAAGTAAGCCATPNAIPSRAASWLQPSMPSATRTCAAPAAPASTAARWTPSRSTAYAHIDLDRCIGCGLCVTTCPNEVLTLVRKPESEIPDVPHNSLELYARIARGARHYPEDRQNGDAFSR